MAYISNENQNKILKDINIKTIYIKDNNILERNTDNSKNDNIKDGIRCKKEYYKNNKLMHTENLFDSRISYSFISDEEENYKCINCGYTGKTKEFLNGCPYCNTNYNIDYSYKDLGSKYHYDLVLNSTKYRVITAIVDVIVSLILSFIFIKTTSRTFNIYDINKALIYELILSLVLYYFFYLMDAYLILSPIRNYKEKLNKKEEEFWNQTKINKQKFYNNLNYEISKKYFKDYIDYDILDYTDFKSYTKDNNLYIEIKASIRLINENFKSKYIEDTYILKKYDKETTKINGGINHIKCPTCGNSIDVNKGKCDYCGKEINYINEWILDIHFSK